MQQQKQNTKAAEIYLLSCLVSNQYMFRHISERVQSDDIFNDLDCRLYYSYVLELHKENVLPKIATVISKSNFNERIITISKEIQSDIAATIEEINICINSLKKVYANKKVQSEYLSAMKLIADGADVFDIIPKMTFNIDDIVNECSSDDGKTLSDATSEVIKDIQDSNGKSLGIPIQFNSLSKFINIKAPDLCIIGGRPGVGKTTFALQIARYITLCGKDIAFFTLEMSSEQLALKIALSTLDNNNERILHGLSSSVVRSGNVSQESLNDLITIQKRQSDEEAKFHIYADSNLYSIMNTIIKLSRNGVTTFFIDYLQLVSLGDKATQNRNDYIGIITRHLKEICIKYKVSIIVLSQLNRQTEGRPSLINLRESGSIEQDADLVLLLFPDSEGQDSDIRVNVAKNRHGSASTVETDPVLHFIKPESRFMDKPEHGFTNSAYTFTPPPNTDFEDIPF